MTRSIGLSALVLGLLTFISAPAHAATASLAKTSCPKEGCNYSVSYRAERGEANRLTSTIVRDGTSPFAHAALVHDDGAPIAVGKGCAAVDEHTVRCSAAGPISLAADLGDGDDVATVDFASLIRGGAGADRLTAELGNLSGGPGGDVLTATGEFVGFVDDDGRHPAPDRYVGSSGVLARLSYAGRRTPIRIDLGAGTAGEDTFSGIRDAVGGSGDDVLVGTDASDVLDGGPGSDHLIGLGGHDLLYGQVGGPERAGDRDRLDGGAGDDFLLGGAGARLDCGAGADDANVFGENALVRASCERISLLPAPVLHLRPADPAFLAADPCTCRRITYVARAGGKVVARTSVGGVPAQLRLNAAGQRLLARDGRLLVTVSTRIHRFDGAMSAASVRVELVSGSRSDPAT